MTLEAKRQRLLLLNELARRQALPINTYTPDATYDRDQLAFHQATARYRLLYGGNQSGKSVCNAYEVAAHAKGEHRFQTIDPGPKEIYVLSAEYRTIYAGIYRHLRPDGGPKDMCFLQDQDIIKEGPRIPGASVPLPSYYHVRCATGGQSTIWFITAEGGESARRKLQAAAIHYAAIDEEISENLWKELRMRLLTNNGRMSVSATLVQSEDWLLELEDRAEEKDPNVSLVRLNTESSPHLEKEAKVEILGDLSDEERAVRVEGKSRRQFGLVYPDFTSEHIFIMEEEFPEGIPDHFKLYAGTDPGFRVHAGLWAALDPASLSIYFYREMYMKDSTLGEVCETIALNEGYQLVNTYDQYYIRETLVEKPERIDVRLIDPAQLRNMENGDPGIAAQMAAFYNTPVVPANNNLQGGIEAVRRLLQINPNTNKPYIRIERGCKNFFSERRKYRYKSDTSTRNAHAMKAEPLRKNNHLMDVFRYLSYFIFLEMGGRSEKPKSSFQYGTTKTYERLQDQIEMLNKKNPTHPVLGDNW